MAAKYLTMVGQLQWLVTLGRFDIHAQVAPCQGLELLLGKDIWTDSRGFTPMPLGLKNMQLGLGLINLNILSYLTKIMIGHILYMVMSKKSYLMTCLSNPVLCDFALYMRIYLSAPDQGIVPKASWHVFLSPLISPPASQLTNYPPTFVLFLVMGLYCPHFYPQKASLLVKVHIRTHHCVGVIGQELSQDSDIFCQSLKGVPDVMPGSNRVSDGKIIHGKNT